MNMVYLPLPYARFPSRWAHSIEHMKMCEAFTRHGVDVRMIYHCAPFSGEGTDLRERARGFYGLRSEFSAVILPGLRVGHPALRALRLDSLSIASTIAPYVLWARARGRLGPRDVIYSRNRAAATALSWLLRCLRRAACPKLVYEVHEPEDRAFAHLAPGLDGVVTISQALCDHLMVEHRVPRDRITVERCAVDVEQFSTAIASRDEARRRLGLPGDGAPIIAYCGRVDASRGVDVLLHAAERFAARGWRCLIVGGTADDARRLPGIDGIADAVIFAGRVPPAAVPMWLSAADVLVAPHAGRGQYDRGSSPLKLFEYMAAQRPVVTARVPAVEEIVRDGEHAVCVAPGSPDDLVRGIAWVCDHPGEARALAARAQALARRHDWAERARRILAFIDGLPRHDSRTAAARSRERRWRLAG